MSLLADLKQRARRLKAETFALYLAARHPDTPWYAKLLAAAIVAYALSPIDLIPDFIPVVGYLDDLVLIPIAVALAVKLVPPAVLAECRARAPEVVAQGKPASRVAGAVIVVLWLAAAAWCTMWAYEAFAPPSLHKESLMFDHIGFGVTDYAASKAFFLQALQPLGIGIVMEGEHGIGIGPKGKPALWLYQGTDQPAPLHLAFAAENRQQVRDFHQAAIAAGGKDNGAPGLRPHYHPNYYGAFVIGPDGHNVEAVCHKPEA